MQSPDKDEPGLAHVPPLHTSPAYHYFLIFLFLPLSDALGHSRGLVLLCGRMKFGKTIQSQQVPGWGEYYLNYKALKKIINSYAAGRPASDASLLSLGLRPAKRTLSHSHQSRPQSQAASGRAGSHALDSPDSQAQSPRGLSASSIPTVSLGAPSSSRTHGASLSPMDANTVSGAGASGGHSRSSGDLDPLPPETEPPAGSRSSGMLSAGTGGGSSRSNDRNESFKAHRDVFFFTLQRELEKVSLDSGGHRLG